MGLVFYKHRLKWFFMLQKSETPLLVRSFHMFALSDAR